MDRFRLDASAPILPRVNLIERQRDQRESGAVTDARTGRRPGSAHPSLPAVVTLRGDAESLRLGFDARISRSRLARAGVLECCRSASGAFPKLALAAAGAALALSVPARGALPPAARWLLALAGLILLAAALTGSTPVAQILRRPPRYEVVLALSVYLGALASGARLLGPRRARGSMA